MSCPGDCLDSVCLALFTYAGLRVRDRELPGVALEPFPARWNQAGGSISLVSRDFRVAE